MFTMRVTDSISCKPENKFAPYERMATVIVDLTAKNGDCLPQDLLQHGLTKQETTELWHMADAMAQVEMRLMENRSMSGCKVTCHA